MNTSEPDVRLGLLRLTCVPGMGPVAIAGVLAACRRRSLRLVEFFALPEGEYRTAFGLRPEAIAALAERGEESWRAARALDREMSARGIEIVADPELPEGFPILFARGNLDLREEPAAAFLASRGAGPEALAVAERAADALAAAEAHLVTGHNRPAYKNAGVAARRRGSALTLVLDRGLLTAWGEEWEREPIAPARVWEERFDAGATLALSPFRLQDDWVAANSRRRDRLVAAWARVLIVTHLRHGGWLEAQCRAAAARGATLILCPPEGQQFPVEIPELPGAWLVPPDRAAEAALAALGPPGAGLRRAEAARRRALARDLAAALPLPAAAVRRDLLPDVPVPTITYGRAGIRGEAPADVLLAEALPGEDPERQVIAWLGGVRPGGILVALLPAPFLAAAEAAGFRTRLLAQGQIRAAVHLPEEWGVCVLRKHERSGTPPREDAPALIVSPAGPLTTYATRRRYMEDARARARAVLAEGLTPPSSSGRAFAPSQTPAGSTSPG
jgi:hypothetical protein